jgi:hypothetical protein
LTSDETIDFVLLTKGYAPPEARGYPDDCFVNQIGGRPLLCQSIPDPQCHNCNVSHHEAPRMYFLASLYNDWDNALSYSTSEMCASRILLLPRLLHGARCSQTLIGVLVQGTCYRTNEGCGRCTAEGCRVLLPRRRGCSARRDLWERKRGHSTLLIHPGGPSQVPGRVPMEVKK